MNRRTWTTFGIAAAATVGLGATIAATYPDPTIPDVCARALANADRGFELAGDGINAILNDDWDRLDTITAQLEANPYAQNRDRCLEETK